MSQRDDRDEPVLPEQTGDDDPAEWGEDSSADDDRLLGEVPPHWQ